MTAGRPRKPTQLKVIQGNPGKRRLPKDEPKPDQASLTPPEWLSADGAAIWDQYAPIVQRLGLLTELDVEFFAMGCLQLAVYRRMMAKVGKSALGRDGKVKPAFTAARQALEQAQRTLSKFGFTPSDRAKLSVTTPPTDPFEEFLEKSAK